MAVFKYGDGAGVPNTHTFSSATSVQVNHSLGYFPQVWIVIGGQLVYGDVTYNNLSSFTVVFQTSETGVIYYR